MASRTATAPSISVRVGVIGFSRGTHRPRTHSEKAQELCASGTLERCTRTSARSLGSRVSGSTPRRRSRIQVQNGLPFFDVSCSWLRAKSAACRRRSLWCGCGRSKVRATVSSKYPETKPNFPAASQPRTVGGRQIFRISTTSFFRRKALTKKPPASGSKCRWPRELRTR